MQCRAARRRRQTVSVDETYIGARQPTAFQREAAPKAMVMTLWIMKPAARPRTTSPTSEPTPFAKFCSRRWPQIDAGFRREQPLSRDRRALRGTRPCFMQAASTSTRRLHDQPERELLLLLKRGIYGVYHHVSKAHLGRYVHEFDFRSKSLGETMAIAAPELAFGFTYKHDDKTFATCTSFPATSCDLTTAANGVGSTTLVTAKKLLSVAMVTSAKRIAGTASTSCGYQPPQRYTSSAPRTRIRARLGRLLRFRLCCLGRMRLALSARLAQLHLGLRLRGHAHQTAQ